MWEYRAAVLEVIDGDTIRCLVDLGFYSRQQVDLRLLGVRAPERNQPGGLETKQFVEKWCSAMMPMKWPLKVATSVGSGPEPVEQRTFTRYVATVYEIQSDASLNEAIKLFLSKHPEWGGGI